MKKIIIALIFLLMAVLSTTTVFAYYRITDEAGVLSDNEEALLEERFEKLSKLNSCDIAAVIVKNYDETSLHEFADAFFDEKGYGYGENRDAVMLAVSTSAREYEVFGSGIGYAVLFDGGLESIEDAFLSKLSDNEYYYALVSFANAANRQVTSEKTDSHEEKEPSESPVSFLMVVISLAVGFIVALIAVSSMRGKLKSVRYNSAASNYVRKGSVNLVTSKDMFLYKNISRVPLPRNDSSSSGGRMGGGMGRISSTGAGRGGGGGRF